MRFSRCWRAEHSSKVGWKPNATTTRKCRGGCGNSNRTSKPLPTSAKTMRPPSKLSSVSLSISGCCPVAFWFAARCRLARKPAWPTFDIALNGPWPWRAGQNAGGAGGLPPVQEKTHPPSLGNRCHHSLDARPSEIQRLKIARHTQPA